MAHRNVPCPLASIAKSSADPGELPMTEFAMMEQICLEGCCVVQCSPEAESMRSVSVARLSRAASNWQKLQVYEPFRRS